MPGTLHNSFQGDSRRALRARALHLLAGFLLVAVASGCGFHPRGEADFAFSTVYLNSPESAAITTPLRRAIESAGSSKAVATSEQAQVVLDINSVEDNKHILSLSSGGKVFEFLLTKRVVFRVHNKDGADWLPTSEVIIRRTYTYSDTEALAKEYEEQRLWREMQVDAIQQIVRRLQSARVPVA
ncbi:MAG: LPS assembly lipoprotein LptE [Casimicrobiaceae bacterium]